MSRRLTARDRRALTWLVLAALVTALVWGVGYAVRKQRWAEQRLTELEPRYARLAGLQGSQADVDRAARESGALAARVVHPSDAPASTVGNNVLQQVRDVMTAAGLQVVSSQVLPARAAAPFERIPLSVRVEGDLPAIQKALLGLASQSPAILVDDLTLQQTAAIARPGQTPRLMGQFSLSLLHAVKPS